VLGAEEPVNVTVVVAVDVLPEASVAVNVTTKLPGTTLVPAAGDCVTTTAPVDGQLSPVVARLVMSANWPTHGVPSSKECVEGALIVGDVVSTTVRVLVHVDVLPAASATVSVIVLAPKPTDAPARGDCVTVKLLLQLSEARTPAVKSGTSAMHEPSADTV
jgi:hypothetical protein